MIWAMKSYVTGYQPIEPGSPRYRPLPNWTEYDVGFSPIPSWTMSLRSAAEIECATLQRFDVRVGAHQCQFTVEEVGPDEFAVCCKSHVPRKP